MLLHAIDIGDGEPLVLLHGLGGSHRDWAAQIEAFACDRRVIAVDLRGHGDSPRAAAGVTIDDLAGDVADSLASRRVMYADVIGWSLGGTIGAVLAAEYAARVRRLVIVNSPPGNLVASRIDRLRLAQRRVLACLPMRWLGPLIARGVFPELRHDELRRQLAESFARNHPSSYRAVLSALARHDDTGVLERVACSALIVAGDRDYWPVAAKRAQAARLARARVAVVESTGHGTPVERPDAFDAIVRGFFDEPHAAPDRGEAPHGGSIATLVVATLLSACASVPTGGSPDASADGLSVAASRCVVTPARATCAHNVTNFSVGLDTREVYWETPLSSPPTAGYPIVILYQGSLFPPRITWDVPSIEPFGGYQQGRLQAMLLDNGYTVIAPTATAGLGWETNIGLPFDLTSDDPFIRGLLVAIGHGDFGAADTSRLYATGISSGGYMTSRMAVTYAGTFRALAIASGSYATCLGPVCDVPATLPANHPPTLFMHGTLDLVVPIATMHQYHDRLVSQGIATALDEDPTAGHQWLGDAPERVTTWFEGH